MCGMLVNMSEQPAVASIPRWDLADRMRKALRHAAMSNTTMAEYLGVTRETGLNGAAR